VIAITAVLVVGVTALFTVYPFLAQTQRVNADVLVVEGWVHDYAIRAAVEEFRHGSYQAVITTGGPVEGSGGYTNDYNTSADVGANLLRKYGLPPEVLQTAPSRVMDRDRTYGAAVALRNWFQQHQLSPRGVNVLTENTHARRSRLLFKRALGNGAHVGVIAVNDPDYDSKRWWRYSEGVKDVVSEGFSYLYTKLFFFGGAETPSSHGRVTTAAAK
jgi:uncharacterized SAM-binding protein YcdF (DUF218 family)